MISRILKKKTAASAAKGSGGKTDSSAGSSPDSLAEAVEMGFLDHLEELRWSLIKGFGAIMACTAVAGFFRRWIIQNVVLAPKNPDFISYRIFNVETTPFVIQNRTITGQFFTDWGTALVVGAIIGSPIFIYQMWRFIEPGLYPNEKQGLRFSSVFATFFFILGISFGYFVITPLALQFFAAYQISPEIQNEFDITKYFEMITFWSFGTGLLFQLPVVVYFLAKLGIATPPALRVARKYALLVALILSAFFTPPDPVSQILVAMPLMLLYEMSIWIAVVVEKRRLKALQ